VRRLDVAAVKKGGSWSSREKREKLEPLQKERAKQILEPTMGQSRRLKGTGASYREGRQISASVLGGKRLSQMEWGKGSAKRM